MTALPVLSVTESGVVAGLPDPRSLNRVSR